MALQGKSRSKSRQKTVARPPKAALERKPKKRGLPINAVTVLATLFVVTLVVVLVWAVLRAVTPKPVPGLSDYVKSSAKARDASKTVNDQISEKVNGYLNGNPATSAQALKDLQPLSGQATKNATDLGNAKASGAADEVHQLDKNTAQLFVQSVALLQVALTTKDVPLQQQLVKKAARVQLLGGALLKTSEERVNTLQSDDTFVAQPADIYHPDTRFEEGPPLLGLPAGTTDPVVKVNRAIQPNAAWAKAAADILKPYDAAIGNSPQVVQAYDQSHNAQPLQQAATSWFNAGSTAVQQLSAQKQPDTMQAVGVVLLDALWVGLESDRSFASIAVQAGIAPELEENGRQLRLVEDQLRVVAQTAATATDKSVQLPAPPVSGFAPTAPAAPSAPPAPASPGVTVPQQGAPPSGNP